MSWTRKWGKKQQLNFRNYGYSDEISNGNTKIFSVQNDFHGEHVNSTKKTKLSSGNGDLKQNTKKSSEKNKCIHKGDKKQIILQRL